MKIHIRIYFKKYNSNSFSTYIHLKDNIIIKMVDKFNIEYYDHSLILPKITESDFNPKNIRKISPMFTNYNRCYENTYKFIKEMNEK